MSACCRIGGLLGRASAEQVEGLTRYGLDIGIAFQISDDSLDFVADQARLGKAVGADLKEGKRTLPLMPPRAAGPADRDDPPLGPPHPRGDRGDPPARGQARGRGTPRAAQYTRRGRAPALPARRTGDVVRSRISPSIATARPCRA
jgi:hypothetical protein